MRQLRKHLLELALDAADASSASRLAFALALFTIRSHHASLAAERQAKLVSLLQQHGSRLPRGTPMPSLGLPWLKQLSPVLLPPAWLPHRRERRGLGSHARSSIFITSPFESRRQEAARHAKAAQALWVAGEAVRVRPRSGPSTRPYPSTR